MWVWPLRYPKLVEVTSSILFDTTSYSVRILISKRPIQLIHSLIMSWMVAHSPLYMINHSTWDVRLTTVLSFICGAGYLIGGSFILSFLSEEHIRFSGGACEEKPLRVEELLSWEGGCTGTWIESRIEKMLIGYLLGWRGAGQRAEKGCFPIYYVMYGKAVYFPPPPSHQSWSWRRAYLIYYVFHAASIR